MFSSVSTREAAVEVTHVGAQWTKLRGRVITSLRKNVFFGNKSFKNCVNTNIYI